MTPTTPFFHPHLTIPTIKIPLLPLIILSTLLILIIITATIYLLIYILEPKEGYTGWEGRYYHGYKASARAAIRRRIEARQRVEDIERRVIERRIAREEAGDCDWDPRCGCAGCAENSRGELRDSRCAYEVGGGEYGTMV